jgi:hypothetical protein
LAGEKNETEIPKKIPQCTEKNQGLPRFPPGEFVHAQLLYPLSALLIMSARAMSTNSLRANKKLRANSLRAQWKTRFIRVFKCIK